MAIVIVVAMIVEPYPVLFLFVRREPAKITVRIVVGFHRPTSVIVVLVMIPDVIVGVIGIVHAIVVVFTGKASRRCGQCRGQECAAVSGPTLHCSPPQWNEPGTLVEVLRHRSPQAGVAIS